mmetsp:Transcript_6808/g.11284  ORF Transcript_6808/g.11284 Transcript_6808/m.11284 type:complete len:1439 (+) Transcript_6808:110-4426(+)|eukprot:CAMPEP_0114463056 /NCGR_PEP_ID=MMETSP0104-20121206/7158_1 /TAXON_ID=37642 ORGANISM="Paraphysomonas imperforata, Strain PA2" /NCGR_SAMPLE_ID=MMETSP0104 /ASSEMBLY_ACC=CAM_ASM_000202 /LENGTH=1438 /DNA_ID=CAMNT_0001635975 /DNA_START=62 /DNA_END=4378 /DNA_ORIENTATION=+
MSSGSVQMSSMKKKGGPFCKIKSFSRNNKAIISDLSAKYIAEKHRVDILRNLLVANGIEIPDDIFENVANGNSDGEGAPLLTPAFLPMTDGSAESFQKLLDDNKNLLHFHPVAIVYNNLNFYTMVSEKKIKTVGSTIMNMLRCGSGPKHRVDILKNISGRIRRGKLTLVMGPPGCGKTTFLRAISGQLNTTGCELEGSVTYNGDAAESNTDKFIVQKIVNFVSEVEVHTALMTVYETFVFAFKATTGGHHGYGKSSSAESYELLSLKDKMMNKVKDVITVLGLNTCKDTYVGNDMIRGVSGGQKRRVTAGEMILLPGEVKVMDAVSNGLDAATTYDIIQSLKIFTTTLKATAVVSLLQPAPEVFNLFDDLILLSQGQIIYHGPVERVLEYFEGIGYVCPPDVDVADFLQEVPMPEGQKYLAVSSQVTDSSEVLGSDAPSRVVGTAQLAAAWRGSALFKDLETDMEAIENESHPPWLKYHSDKYAASFMFYLRLLLEREVMVLKRDLSFMKSRIVQVLLVGIIVSTLFTNLETTDTQTMGGFLFFACLQGGLSAMSLLPVVFSQKAVFYKQYQASFFPAPSFVMAQSFVLLPQQVVESILFGLINYFSVGLSTDEGGSRFFLFVLIILCFGVAISQVFRLIGSLTPESTAAKSMCGVTLVLMVLFSGYIIPKNGISDGWIWFYWMNPLAYALKAVTVNEFLGSEYDFLICGDYPACSQQLRYGDVVLESRGNPTDEVEIWYGILFLIGVYILALIATTLALVYVVVEPRPVPPEYEDIADSPTTLATTKSATPTLSTVSANKESDDVVKAEVYDVESGEVLQPAIIPFEPVSFAFKDVWYTVKLKGGEELDLLRGVDGCFEPGTVTALMGSSGAGKTTLLDVLAGRKNTGTVSGLISVNGAPKEEKAFRKVMAYVEQFDSLSPADTAREAVEFSAALRLPANTTAESRAAWVESIIDMLELGPIEHMVVGTGQAGFSFEQRKRLSIAVELAANPSILFLDEPTSGLDSRSAQVAIRSIKRVAASGRSVVCTIHQPSVFIFNSFESLLLLRRGGQTVFYGDLGEKSTNLIKYFEGAPGVVPCGRHNPATWMLDLIGAGTGGSSSFVDFHQYYQNSNLCEVNTARVDALCTTRVDHNSTMDEDNIQSQFDDQENIDDSRASIGTQFILLLKRGYTSYWRNPSYNLVRMIISIVIALLFASAYADYTYTTDVDTISLAAVIYVTSLFVGIVGMNTVQSVTFAERPAFYRERQSNMYSPFLYVLANTLVEIPYIILSSLLFVLPFFFLVDLGVGDVTAKFIWYWVFTALMVCSLVFAGQFFAVLLRNEAAAMVIAGLFTTIQTLFSGFMVPAAEIPPYWLFLYYVNPLHYCLEGIIVTLFRNDDTSITLYDGEVTTAERYISDFFSEWKYENRYFDVLALLLFIATFRVGTYLSLKYLTHQQN